MEKDVELSEPFSEDIDKEVDLPTAKRCCVSEKVGKYANCDTCPKCGDARYEVQTKIPRKRFRYIPLAPRLQRLFHDSYMSQKLQSHSKRNDEPTSKVMTDIHDSAAWTSKYSDNGAFQGDPRGVSLALCTDGMNPFSKMNQTYSMWPIVLTVLNLPRHIRNLAGSMLLSGIIPGRSEPKNMDAYLDVLVEEIMHMNTSEVYDGYRNETFHLKVQLLLNVPDYPGQNKLFHTQGTN